MLSARYEFLLRHEANYILHNKQTVSPRVLIINIDNVNK